ncbi:MAG TPA: threonine/serine exporter family protein [Cyclobacteriaceae bacterium]|nr:threonine/serine exporter family protein [Cyclobacteriaceae bacterium]
MNEWYDILAKAFWCGFASLGFGVLFNAPPRTLFAIWFGGFIAGFVKFGALQTIPGSGVILGSFIAAVTVGIASIPVAHLRHVPPMIFAVPSVIPLIPGVFAYRTMLGLMKLTGNITGEYSQVMAETVHNGVITLFVIMALSLGVTIPMHVMSRDSVKKIRWK